MTRSVCRWKNNDALKRSDIKWNHRPPPSSWFKNFTDLKIVIIRSLIMNSLMHEITVNVDKYLFSLGFYFVGEASKFENLFFVLFLDKIWSRFSNLQISVFWAVFLHIMDSLLIRYNIIMFLSGTLSGFQVFSVFFRIFFKSSYFSLPIKYGMIILFSGFYPVSWFIFWIIPVFPFFPDFVLLKCNWFWS